MTIPNTVRVPFMAVEFDPSRANNAPAILSYKALLIGQLLSTGTKYAAGSDAVGPFRVTSADQAGQFFGLGSMLHRMAVKWFAKNRSTELHAIGLKDNGTTKAAGSIAISGTATAAGTLFAYINGALVQVAVDAGDAASAVGAALVAALPTSAPVSAVNTSGSVAFTAKNAGTVGNAIDLRVNYNEGETVPAGLTVVVTAMSAGATDIDIADAIALFGQEWYQIIVGAYTDATNLTAIETELATRYGWAVAMDGLYITSKRGALSALASFGNGRNSPHVTCLHDGGVVGTGCPTWTPELAAAYAAQIALEGAADPARPLQTLELSGVLSPAVGERFTMEENNSLLFDGVSTFGVGADGVVRIQRAITMYQTNEAGAADPAYLDVETMLTLMYLRYSFRNKIQTRYARAKLANDGTNIGPGQQVITPKIGKAEAVAWFREMETLGLVENFDQFKRDLVCVRSSVDANRLEWLLPPDLVNQFRVGAATVQFLLQG